jgi:hypothetical protein
MKRGKGSQKLPLCRVNVLRSEVNRAEELKQICVHFQFYATGLSANDANFSENTVSDSGQNIIIDSPSGGVARLGPLKQTL